MRQLLGCEVKTDDHIHPELTGAKVTILGESGGAIVKIAERDPRPDVLRYLSVDRLTDATFSEQGDQFTITGKSDHLAGVIGVEDTTVTVRVKAKRGCSNCGGRR